MDQIQPDFSLNDLITFCNLLCIYNEGSLVHLNTILNTYLWDLNFLQANIIQNESENDSETELCLNYARKTQNDASLRNISRINAELFNSDKNIVILKV